MKWLLFIALLTLPGCYVWSQTVAVTESDVRKLETPLAADFCTAYLGQPAAACAAWTDLARTRCVIVVPPGSAMWDAHERRHCAGWDH